MSVFHPPLQHHLHICPVVITRQCRLTRTWILVSARIRAKRPSAGGAGNAGKTDLAGPRSGTVFLCPGNTRVTGDTNPRIHPDTYPHLPNDF
ncbi:hypothetical protein LAD64_27680 [Klebsiella pneumoniae]|nr:hypothetical protein [Klebsiella pneumoniae]